MAGERRQTARELPPGVTWGWCDVRRELIVERHNVAAHGAEGTLWGD